MIEALCALAVALIVTSYAVPAYFERSMRAHRVAAVLALNRAAHYLETQRLEVAAGMSARADSPFEQGLDFDTLPVELAQSPPAPARAAYRLAVSTTPGGGYRIAAAPVRGGLMARDRCGVLTLDASGRLSTSGLLDPQACWTGP
jgi:type IV pilus assembly protein PilE